METAASELDWQTLACLGELAVALFVAVPLWYRVLRSWRRVRVVGEFNNKAGAARAAAEVGRYLKPRWGESEGRVTAVHEYSHAERDSGLVASGGRISVVEDGLGRPVAAYYEPKGSRTPDQEIDMDVAPARRKGTGGMSEGDRANLKQNLKKRRKSGE